MMITPSDSPSSPENYAGVAVQPMDIQAPQGDLSAAVAAAGAVAGAGVVYPQGPRQAATERLLDSPQGYADFDITPGFTAGGQWPGDVTPDGG
jgi:hypothetical protein